MSCCMRSATRCSWSTRQPSAHARDLLAAPNRLTNLLTSRAVSLLQAPASCCPGRPPPWGGWRCRRCSRRCSAGPGSTCCKTSLISSPAFEEMIEGFNTRAAEVNRLLRGPATAFVLVTTAEPHTIETAIDFHHELTAGGFPVAGIVANRVLAFPRLTEAEQGLAGWDEPLRRKLVKNYGDLCDLSRREPPCPQAVA